MNKLFERIGFAITSMAAVIFVLVLTLLGLLTFTHTLFNEVLPQTITGFERSFASWMLALGWEFTLLISTCNTQFLNKRIPMIVAIASGVIVLFFIQAFAIDQPLIELSKRWFIGVLVATINYIYTELFYAKWKELQLNKSLTIQVNELESKIATQTKELTESNTQLTNAKTDVERLIDYVAELETFKKQELDRLKCPYCHTQMETIYKLTSHKGICQHNPKKELKQSIYQEA
jgi:uncharacterized coiled-coil protein SlyX